MLTTIQRRRELLRRAPAFRTVLFARIGSGLGTYLAAVALQVDVFDRTHSGTWVSALLIVEFLPQIVLGLVLGPLLDRWPRRTMMLASDLANLVVFVLLGFTSSATQVVALAAAAGVANGFFRPVVYAALPNLVEERDLESASSVLQTVEFLAMLVGAPLGGLILVVSSARTNYWINAATFAVSVLFVLHIPREKLQSLRAVSQGHWRDLAAGLRLVRRSGALFTVAVAWPIVIAASSATNVAEVVLAKHVFSAGDVGFGVLVGASGIGQALGSFLSGPANGRFGLARTYAGSIALFAVGAGLVAVSPNVWVAAAFFVAGSAGNGSAIVCNFVLIARGAPDELRGRAVTVLMSIGSTAMLAAMVASGRLTDTVGARWVWGGAALVALAGAAVAYRRARSLPAGGVVPIAVPEGGA